MNVYGLLQCCLAVTWIVQQIITHLGLYTYELLSMIFSLMCLDIFRFVYLHGPTVFGMWNGKPVADICASLTNVPASHWRSAFDECSRLVQRQVIAYAIGFYLIAGIWAAYMYCSHLWYRHTVWNPVLDWVKSTDRIQYRIPYRIPDQIPDRTYRMPKLHQTKM